MHSIFPRAGAAVLTTRFLRAAASLFVATSFFVATASRADEPDPRNRVGFSLERSRDVENDWVTATAGVTLEDADPAQLADRINKDVTWALGLAKNEPGLRVRSAGYRTYPVEDRTRGTVRHWRGSQTLVVEGADATQVSALLGRWQERLQLQGLNFSVSPERRRAVEDELIVEVLEGFRARAEIVREKLGARSYEIVQIQVDSLGGGPSLLRMQTLSAAEGRVAPPALEGGTSEVSVRASASIELLF